MTPAAVRCRIYSAGDEGKTGVVGWETLLSNGGGFPIRLIEMYATTSAALKSTANRKFAIYVRGLARIVGSIPWTPLDGSSGPFPNREAPGRVLGCGYAGATGGDGRRCGTDNR